MNNKAFGLIELLICAAIATILFLAFAQMASQQTRFIRNVELTVSWLELEFDILSTLSHLQTCSLALPSQPMTLAPAEASFFDQGGTFLTSGVVYQGLKILHLQTSVVSVLSPTQVVGKVFISVQKIGQVSGPPILNKSFTAQFDVLPAGTVVDCF